jgi:hypothetical protein
MAMPEVLCDLTDGFPITRILSHYCGVEVLPLRPDGMVKLNDSAAEILRRCTGRLTVDGIVAGTSKRIFFRGDNQSGTGGTLREPVWLERGVFENGSGFVRHHPGR